MFSTIQLFMRVKQNKRYKDVNTSKLLSYKYCMLIYKWYITISTYNFHSSNDILVLFNEIIPLHKL